jgi:pyruvate dehydrogenase E2 component (dihydrolipoamide acetyltransferase)
MGIFTMPSLGADMEAGKLVEWMVKPGDTVKRGDVVAVVETQKGAIEIEIFEEGEVSELTAELGTELPGRSAARRCVETGRGAARARGGPRPGTDRRPQARPGAGARTRHGCDSTRPGAARRACPGSRTRSGTHGVPRRAGAGP